MTTPGQSAVALELVNPQRAADLVDQLAPIYTEVYAEPPYDQTSDDTSEFIERYRRQTRQEGFRLVTAVDGEQIIGFCYTITLPAGRWWKGAQESPSDELLSSAKAAVVELVLLAPYRGCGLGRAIIQTALANREEPWATLLAEPDTPARRIYEHWGWRQVGTVQSQPHWSPDDALVLKL